MAAVARCSASALRQSGLSPFSDISAGQFLGHMVAIADVLLSSSNVVEPKVRADLKKIKSIGSVKQTTAA